MTVCDSVCVGRERFSSLIMSVSPQSWYIFTFWGNIEWFEAFRPESESWSFWLRVQQVEAGTDHQHELNFSPQTLRLMVSSCDDEPWGFLPWLPESEPAACASFHQDNVFIKKTLKKWSEWGVFWPFVPLSIDKLKNDRQCGGVRWSSLYDVHRWADRPDRITLKDTAIT